MTEAPTLDPVEVMARAAREEVVRQHRENERSKCPAGAYFYEEHVSPHLVAQAALQALQEAGWAVVPKEPTEAMVVHAMANTDEPHSLTSAYAAMIAAALNPAPAASARSPV